MYFQHQRLLLFALTMNQKILLTQYFLYNLKRTDYVRKRRSNLALSLQATRSIFLFDIETMLRSNDLRGFRLEIALYFKAKIYTKRVLLISIRFRMDLVFTWHFSPWKDIFIIPSQRNIVHSNISCDLNLSIPKSPGKQSW